MVLTKLPEIQIARISVEDLVASIDIDQRRSEPLHSQLKNSLVRLLDTGEFAGMSFAPERSLANGLGVSRVTVRRALDDLRRDGRLARRVGKGTFVTRHGSQDSVLNPQNTGFKAIGLIGLGWESEFVRETAGQLMAACQMRGLGLHLHKIDLDSIDSFAGSLASASDDEALMLFAGERGGRKLYDDLSARGYRLVSIDLMSDFYEGSIVTTDASEAVRIGLKHLMDLGHQRVTLLVNEYLRDESVLVKVEEFSKSASRLGITGRIVICAEDIKDGYESAYRRMPEVWLNGGTWSPTAIMTVSDPGAWAALKWLREQGVSVPRDVSIVGFEDANSSQHVLPPLTTIAHPIVEVVDSALETLLAPVGNSKLRILIKPKLVVRESTGPPRQN